MRLLLRQFLLLLLISAVFPCMAWGAVIDEPGPEESVAEKSREKPVFSGPWITADHSRFPMLQEDFTSGPEVTSVCLRCHNEAGKQIRETIHWTWLCPADPSGRMGKNGITLNNF